MKDNESPLNIFHQKAKKEPQKELSNTVGNEIQRSNTMMSQLQEMQSKIEEELEKLVKVSGASRDEIWQFLERSHNFAPDKWEQAQVRYKELKEKISDTLAIDSLDLSTSQTKAPTKEQHRKAKFTGARRNWLSTR